MTLQTLELEAHELLTLRKWGVAAAHRWGRTKADEQLVMKLNEAFIEFGETSGQKVAFERGL